MTRWYLLVILAVHVLASSAWASEDHRGKDFWLNFNYSDTPRLFITSETNTSGQVTLPRLGISLPFSISAGSGTTVYLPTAAVYPLPLVMELLDGRGVHVEAQNEVSVYGFIDAGAAADGFLVFPTNTLGHQYLLVTYGGPVGPWAMIPQFSVLATMDCTRVTITPSNDFVSHMAGVPYTITLDEGQVYTAISMEFPGPSDFSGTIVVSDKPVAVFSGDFCTVLPGIPGFTCNHIVEQVPPESSLGTNFMTVPFANRGGGDFFRFVAAEDGTSVSVNGSLVATLNRGDFHEEVIAVPAWITSDKPILVAQFATGGHYDGPPLNNADPSLVLVPHAGQYLDRYLVCGVTRKEFRLRA